MAEEHERRKGQRIFHTVWGELAYVCRRIHHWLYGRGDKTSAARYLNRLQRLLKALPENDRAILREEGLALFHELRGETSDAIIHRQREIQLMDFLHKEAETGGYEDSTKAFMLSGREITVLQERKAILRALEEEGQ